MTSTRSRRFGMAILPMAAGALLLALPVRSAAGDDWEFPCIEGVDGSVLLDQWVPDSEVARWRSRLEITGPRYVVHGRITSTSTNGAVPANEPVTVTFSFVPDGTVISGASFAGDATSPSNLFAMMDANFPGGRTAWQTTIRSTMAMWGDISGINYVEVTDDGAPFPSSGGAVGTRGDLRIGMHPIGAAGIAYSYFPNGMDMVLDSNDIGHFVNSSNDFRILRQVLLHECGHGFGLDHVEPRDKTKIMEAVVPTTFTGPRQDDIRAVQRLYGDDLESNDSFGEARELGLPPIITQPGEQPRLIEDLSLEILGNSDFYRFNSQDHTALSVIIVPIGTSYSQGPVGGGQSTVDAPAIQDLTLKLIDTDQSTELAFANDRGIGLAEFIIDYPIEEGRQRFLQVSAAGGADDVQRYQLQISLARIPVIEAVLKSILDYVVGRSTDATGLDRNEDALVDSADAIHRILNPGT